MTIVKCGCCGHVEELVHVCSSCKMLNKVRLKEGGAGSGNFGHSGRPGEVGGSGEGGGGGGENISTADESKSMFKDIGKTEPKFREDTQASTSRTGARLDRLETSRKTQESIQRKMDTYMNDHPGSSVKEAAKEVKDAVRYTVVADQKRFSAQVAEFDSEMQRRGYKIEKVTNYYQKTGPAAGSYTGINAKYINPKISKFPFEVQFHTESSLDIAEKNHPHYEIARKIGVSKSEYMSAQKAMAKNWKGFVPPKGAEKLFIGGKRAI